MRGIGAYANEAYDEAVDLIGPAYAQLVRVGGSHAQREVFEDTLLEAYLRAGRFDQAETLLRTRLKRRASMRDMYWLGRAQAGKGQAEGAATTIAEAADGWRGADPQSAEMGALSRVAAGAV